MVKKAQYPIGFANSLSRRDLLKKAAIGAAVFGGMSDYVLADSDSVAKPPEYDFPVVDYHVHLYHDPQKAADLSKSRGVKFGIVEHTERGYNVEDDTALKKYIETLKKYPVYIGLQPLHVGWSKNFSVELLSQLDYVLMDALTMPQEDRSWRAIDSSNFRVNDKESFMKKYVDFNMQILTTEPIDIFGWTTFLPKDIAEDYDALWTDDIMRMMIDTAVKKDIAFEINESAKVPKLKFVKMAKEAGAKFTFGSDSHQGIQAGIMTYGLELAKQAGLTKEDMFVLKPDGKKAVQRFFKKKEETS
ncbi:MAG: twin-arginine translocation signal domain-containing protein [Sedimentisphaerales bacterium]|nr:twin-arginine translocation signal domain-containing protein [Sedimentisphaerales bacterium]